jgi:hypothetical protein
MFDKVYNLASLGRISVNEPVRLRALAERVSE